MNIIFSGDAGDFNPRCIFSGQGHLFFLPVGQCRACNTYAYIQKIPYFHALFDKDHLLSFSTQRKTIIFYGEKKHHLSRYYKKDRGQVRISWKENIIFPGIFLRKIIFPFVSKE